MAKYRVTTVGITSTYYRVQVWRWFWPFWTDIGARFLDTERDAYRSIELLKDIR